MTSPASPGTAISLDDYIESARGEIHSRTLAELRGFRDRILEKLSTPQAQSHHDLQEGVHLLLGVIESPRALAAGDPLPLDLAEAGVALAYLLKGVDLIPDSLPEIGLTDDARLVACVLARNPGLGEAL